MDRLSGLDARRVMHTLSSNLEKELKLWKPIVFKQSSEKEMSGLQRDKFAAWIRSLAAEFKFLPETCGLAIRLMDRVQQLFKVQAKYMQCVAVTCLYIAAKTLEEDENIPPTPDLVRRSHCGCSFAEITRMEMVILNKLNWDVRQPSAVDFLHTIHVVLVMHYPHLLSSQSGMSPSEQLSTLMRKMLRCLCTHTLLQFRPSTIALALISLELEVLTPGWLRLVLALQRMTNVGSEQLMQCRESIGLFLGQQPMMGYTGQNRHSSSSAPQSKKRKVEHNATSVEDENIYEGIKRLYNEDCFVLPSPASSAGVVGGAERCALRTSCSLEMHQDTEENTLPAGLGQTLLVN
ncbi:cyclin-I [Aplysia californica]|uniref:Cyclin-I n=1 Tax=Aplysia californica TaxID=6500 RepID=A0ABM0K892_APLCA|nr:cyclin-I [Aplysia californica]